MSVGQRGPAPLPDNVRTLRGDAAAKPSVRRVKAVPAIPSAPAWLPAEARAEWKRITPELHRMGILAKLDRAALALYCDAWDKFVRAAKVLEDETLVERDSHGPKKHPAWPIYSSAATTCSNMAKELLLTPSSRLRATLPEADAADATADIVD